MGLVAATPSAAASVRYASHTVADGSGAPCTQADPCSLFDAVTYAGAGDTVQLTADEYYLDRQLEVLVDNLTIRGPSAVAAYLSLSIVSGPGAEQMTLIWPTATPGTAVLESSTNLMDPWTEITDTPTVNGDNNELIISTTGVPKNFFRLRNP